MLWASNAQTPTACRAGRQISVDHNAAFRIIEIDVITHFIRCDCQRAYSNHQTGGCCTRTGNARCIGAGSNARLHGLRQARARDTRLRRSKPRIGEQDKQRGESSDVMRKEVRIEIRSKSKDDDGRENPGVTKFAGHTAGRWQDQVSGGRRKKR